MMVLSSLFALFTSTKNDQSFNSESTDKVAGAGRHLGVTHHGRDKRVP